MRPKRNTFPMIETRKQDSLSTEQRINDAIDKMKTSGKPITFEEVAKIAECSRTTVYKHAKERINGIKALQNKKTTKDVGAEKDKLKERNDKLKAQHDIIKKLEQDLEMAMLQLVEMEELRREIDRLKKVNDRLIKRNSELEKDILKVKADKRTRTKVVEIKR